jgi:hypothetical protein
VIRSFSHSAIRTNFSAIHFQLLDKGGGDSIWQAARAARSSEGEIIRIEPKTAGKVPAVQAEKSKSARV